LNGSGRKNVEQEIRSATKCHICEVLFTGPRRNLERGRGQLDWKDVVQGATLLSEEEETIIQRSEGKIRSDTWEVGGDDILIGRGSNPREWGG